MSKRSPLILLALVLAAGRSMAAPDAPTPNPARFAALQDKAAELEAKGDYKAAARSHHRSQIYAPDDRNRAKALLGEADGYYHAGVYPYAKDAYLKLLTAYPLYAPQAHVIERLRKLAEMYASGTTGGFRLKDVPEAIAIYETIVQETPAATGTIGDHLRLAELLASRGNKEEAIVTYQELIRRHAGRPEVDDARLALAAMLIEQTKSGDGDGRLARQARRQLAAFHDAQPNHPRRDEAAAMLAQIDEQQASTLYSLAAFYTRDPHRRLPAAQRYLQQVMATYPGTDAAAQAKELHLRLFGDAESGTAISPEEAEARADLVNAPRLAEKVANMLNTVPRPAEAQGKAKQYPPLATEADADRFLLPVGDLNALDKGEQ